MVPGEKNEEVKRETEQRDFSDNISRVQTGTFSENCTKNEKLNPLS